MRGILENKKGEGRAAVRAVVWPPKEHDEEEADTGEEVDDEDACEEDLARVRS